MADKPFRPMKAADVDYDKLKFPYMVTPKLDGHRCVIVDGVAMTSTMKPFPNKHVQFLFGRPEYNGLDGELVVGDPTAHDVFEKTSSGVRKVEGEPEVRFFVFDRHEDGEAIHRASRVLTLLKGLDDENFMRLPWVTFYYAENKDELDALVDNFLKLGYEGAMLRSATSPYRQGRSTVKENYLLKVKPMADAEAMVTAINEQMANTNEAKKDELGRTKRSTAKAGKVGKGTAGSFTVLALNGPHAGQYFDIGSGLDDATRQDIWDNKEKYMDRVLTYKYQPVGNYKKPRLPIFLRFRDGEDYDVE